ncbi:MAG: hypothetical protein J6D03_06630 [Clostridia bacterium]|nr:hypothetical protein [Clostridia bacterium]
MKNKITEKIDKIDFITRYTAIALMVISGFIALLIQNDVLCAISITLGMCAIANIIILDYIKSEISDIFFKEELNNLKKEGK